jgi:hypothetical protein
VAALGSHWVGGEGWEGSHSAADSHIFFLAIRREFGGHKNFVLHPNHQGLFLWRRNPFEIKVISEKPINQESLLFTGGLISKTKDPMGTTEIRKNVIDQQGPFMT